MCLRSWCHERHGSHASGTVDTAAYSRIDCQFSDGVHTKMRPPTRLIVAVTRRSQQRLPFLCQTGGRKAPTCANGMFHQSSVSVYDYTRSHRDNLMKLCARTSDKDRISSITHWGSRHLRSGSASRSAISDVVGRPTHEGRTSDGFFRWYWWNNAHRPAYRFSDRLDLRGDSQCCVRRDRIVLASKIGMRQVPDAKIPVQVYQLLSLDTQTGHVKDRREIIAFGSLPVFATNDEHVIVAGRNVLRLTPDLKDAGVIDYQRKRRELSPDGSTLGNATNPGYELIDARSLKVTKLTASPAYDTSVSSKGFVTETCIGRGNILMKSDSSHTRTLLETTCFITAVAAEDHSFLRMT